MAAQAYIWELKIITHLRTLVIGDIHGYLDLLKELLHKANFNPQQDRLVCIGDYIDTGPDGFEVVDYLMNLQASSPIEHVFILGNHDEYFVKIFSHDLSDIRNERFVRNLYEDWLDLWEGYVTYESYMKQSDDAIQRHLDGFYKNLHWYYKDGSSLYMHAGFDPDLGFEKTLAENKAALNTTRKLYHAAHDIYKSEIKDPEQFKIFDSFTDIFIGHTPTPKLGIYEPVRMGNLVNVDQGIKIGERMTIYDTESGEYHQCKL